MAFQQSRSAVPIGGTRGGTRGDRRGVLLLLVMACILIVGIATVGVTRQSLQIATDSIAAERELQRRWGVISMQRMLLQGAPMLFGRLDEQARAQGRDGPSTRTIRSAVMLGGIRFDALLADESAKLNLNLVYHRRGVSYAKRLVGQMSPLGTLRVRLMPEIASARFDVQPPKVGGKEDQGDDDDSQGYAQGDEDDPPPAPAFRHWGQVFDLAHSHAAHTARTLLPAATTRLSCWGRGQVNLVRAPDAVVEQACRLVLGQAEARRFLEDYRENPHRSIQQLAQQQKVSDQAALDLQQLVGTQSSSYSLWLTVSSSSNAEQWFAVSAPALEGAIRTDRFQY